MKFLDLEGLKTLWGQISLNDYPKNETLIAVINAIDETKADKVHNHDDVYYTQAEVDEKLNSKADTSAIPTALAVLSDDETHRTVTDAEKELWNSKSDFSGNYNDLFNKPVIPSIEGLATEGYVNEQIATIPTPDVSGQINTHNTSDSAHSDIRLLVEGLTTRLNTLANSDDITLDQMSEIVAYIKNNKSLIDGITTSKVNVDDIINNLTTNVSNKPLSAAQGVALKGLIDAIPAWAKAANKPTYTASEVGAAASSHSHDDKYYTESEIDSKVSTLNTAISGKAASSHTHAISEITSLQSTLDGKAASSHNHAASNITSGTLSSDRLPTVPIAKGGTGATTAAAALTNLGITATATELNYVDGVTSNIQTQLGNKAAKDHTHNYAGSSSAGGAATTVAVTDTTPTSATTYYPLYATGISGAQTVRGNKDLYYYDTGSSGYFNIGSSNQLGGLTLHHSNGKYINLVPTSATANRDITLPDVSGTVITTGNLPSLSTLGAAASSHTHAISNVTNLQSSLDAKVPTSRTINGKALSSNISLTASDVGAVSQSAIDSLDVRLSTLESSVVTTHSGAEAPISTLGEDGDLYLMTW